MAAELSEDLIEPKLTLPGVEVYIGDAIDVVHKLVPKYGGKINTMITSPPYFNLRDYGTSTWEGGDADCDHGIKRQHGSAKVVDVAQSGHAAKENKLNRKVCKCGAARVDQQIGLENTVEAYVNRLADLFDSIGECLLRPDGSLWINLGDSYAGSGGAGGDYNPGGLREGQPKWKPPKTEWPTKSLMMVPERFALEMIRRGWILRNKVIWFKGKDVDKILEDEDGGAPTSNGMPVSAEDRLKGTYEVVFHFVRQRRYFYDLDAIREAHTTSERFEGREPNFAPHAYMPDSGVPGYRNRAGGDGVGFNCRGRNPGDMWAIPTSPFPMAHFATFPPALVHRPVKATCPETICRKCGKPRKAIQESTGVIQKREPTHTPLHKPTKVDSTGWTPANLPTGTYTDCGCNAGWEGGIVLDPFGGSGSTAQGAFEARPPKVIDGYTCQPKVILIDLDERNLQIIEKRLTGRAKQSRKPDLSKYGEWGEGHSNPEDIGG